MSRFLMTGACLTALIAAIYFQTYDFDFVSFDDPQLVTENAIVRQGLTARGAKWAFFSAWRENVFFYPLSLASHMADVTLFGLDAGRHHLTSVAIHAATALAVLLLLTQLTGAVWRPALAAGLFAVHPLSVDSVAWVAERSNVLCAFFTITTFSAYARYVVFRKKRWYGLCLGLFCLALLAKPTAVMAPVILLLIAPAMPGADKAGPGRPGRFQAVKDIFPLAVLAAVRLAAVLAGAGVAGPVPAADAMTAGALAANAPAAVVTYLVRVVYPFRLSVYYPFPGHIPWWRPIAAAGLLLLLTAAAFLYRRRRPMVLPGWLWFLVFLIPSLGVIRSGPWPAMADHYAYLPSVGLFSALVWALPERAGKSRRGRTAAAVIGLGAVVFFAAVSFWHVRHYRDSVTLFTRAVAVDGSNFPGYIGLGNAWRQRGDLNAAEAGFRKALALKPDAPEAHNNLGLVLADKAEWVQAEHHFLTALALSPGFSMARSNLAGLYLKQNRVSQAVDHYRLALAADPSCVPAHYNLGRILAAQGDWVAAGRHLQRALALRPGDDRIQRALAEARGRSRPVPDN